MTLIFSRCPFFENFSKSSRVICKTRIQLGDIQKTINDPPPLSLVLKYVSSYIIKEEAEEFRLATTGLQQETLAYCFRLLVQGTVKHQVWPVELKTR